MLIMSHLLVNAHLFLARGRMIAEKIAKPNKVFVMAQAKRHEEIPDRFFNVGFIMNPEEMLFKALKLPSLLLTFGLPSRYL